MEHLVETLHALLLSNLMISSPVLSGNMKSFIQTGEIGEHEANVIIDAPFYDLKKWEKEGVVVHTGETIEGRTAYAEWVNRLGAFGRPNKSQFWVNRAILEVCYVIANEIGAEVVYEL